MGIFLSGVQEIWGYSRDEKKHCFIAKQIWHVHVHVKQWDFLL